MPITHEALWNKAKVFIERGFDCRNSNKMEEFQLWAALSLELLAKASLAHTHPAFVVEPDLDSLLVAFGKSKSPEFKTLAASKVFDRCRRMIDGFDDACKTFCIQISGRRNADLHSGDAPFSSVPIQGWQSKYWAIAKILVEAQDETLESFLGAAEAAAAGEIVADAANALGVAVRGRVASHAIAFRDARSPEVMANLLATSKVAVAARLDHESNSQDCPACGCAGFLTGTFEDEVDAPPAAYTEDDPPWLRWVIKIYSSDFFRCTGCQLRLDGRDELEIAGVPIEFEKQEAKEYDEGDYGND